MEINIYKFADKKPEDRQVCWVFRSHYPELLSYNSYSNCWDDEEGDDYIYDVSDTDLWMALPTGTDMQNSFANE